MSLLEGYRLFTGNYIYESDIASEDKLELIRFLKEANADDIVDILSGKYAVEGLTEEDMEAVNNFLEGKVSTALKAGRELAGKAGKKVSKVMGYEKLAAAKAAKKGAVVKPGKFTTARPYGSVTPTKVKAGKKAATSAYRKALVGAAGRTALATGAVGGAGYGGYKVAKK
jgi:hypothetical protein